MQHFVFNVRHQFDEHVVRLGLVLDEGILLGVATQINAFAQSIHRVEMLLPEPIDCVQNDVALEAFDRTRFLMTRFTLVSILDLSDQELGVFIDSACLELRFLLR